MAITSGFFNSVNGDRVYNAEQIGEYFGSLISSGVLPNPSTNLQVRAKNGMNIQVLDGKGFIDCHWIKNVGVLDLTIDTADSVLNRIDAVIMKFDTTTAVRAITIEVKKGTLASTPVAPTMTRSASVKEYCLATVYVAKQATAITQANITDTRANSDVCGWVTGLITQVDTAELFIQMQTAYEEMLADQVAWEEEQRTQFDDWFDTLTSTLNVNTYIQKFHKVVEVEATTSAFALDMSGYSYNENDILTINANGIMLVEIYEYMINTTGTTPIIELLNPMLPGNLIEITILKSKIGSV